MAAGLLLSLGLSLATLYLVAFRLRLPAPAALLAMAGLVSSKSFVDYSTSGLENPLTHLLFVLLVAEHLRGHEAAGCDPEAESRRRALRVTFAGWVARAEPTGHHGWSRCHFSCRPMAVCTNTFRGAGKTLVVGFAPLLLWELFAVVYYGFPFPNTAYAKLAAGIPSSELWLQGLATPCPRSRLIPRRCS